MSVVGAKPLSTPWSPQGRPLMSAMAAATFCLVAASRFLRQTMGDSGIGCERQITWKSSPLISPLATAESKIRSATAAPSTLLLATAMMLASCEPEKITREKCFSGSKPSASRPALGNRWPEVDVGSTKANVLRCSLATLSRPESLRVMSTLR
ncbi:hypothetical protein D3C78_1384520 [compost metagenome]